MWMITAIKNGIVHDGRTGYVKFRSSKPGEGIISKPMKKEFNDRPNWFVQINGRDFNEKDHFHAQKSGWDVKYVKRGETAENNLELQNVGLMIYLKRVRSILNKEDFTEDADGAVIEKIIIKGCWVNEIGDSPNSSLTINNPR